MKLIAIIPIAYKKMQRRGIAENWVQNAGNSPDGWAESKNAADYDSATETLEGSLL